VRPIPIKEWGHPKGAYSDGILNVPWIVYESKNRKDISTGDSSNVSTDGKTKDRLKKLNMSNRNNLKFSFRTSSTGSG
jgi:hypothetical protein